MICAEAKVVEETNLSDLTAREGGAKLLVRPPVNPVVVLVVHQLVQLGAGTKVNFY